MSLPQIKEAKLETKNRQVILDACDELLQMGILAINKHKDELRRKAEAGEAVRFLFSPPSFHPWADPFMHFPLQITSNMRQKAVLIEFRGVGSINAETVVSRHFDLKAVHEHLSRVSDLSSWRVPTEHIRPTQNWSIEWGPEQDAKLVLGVWQHGVGSWEAMAQDPTLGFQGKFFLEDQKNKPLEDGQTRSIPNAVHLVRRADYLAGQIREYVDLSKSIQQSHGMQPSPGMQPSVLSGSSWSSGYPQEGQSHASSSSSSSKKGKPQGGAASQQQQPYSAVPAGLVDPKGKRKSTPVFSDSSDESD